MKKYITPKMEVVNIQMTTHLLQGSKVPLGGETGDQWAPEFDFEEDF